MTLIQKTDQYGRPDYTERWDGCVPEIPTFEETADGRRRKGELEILVDYIIKEWIVYDDDELDYDITVPTECTAEYIARRAEEIDGRPTSSDAVWRALKKMRDLGYVDIKEERPHRFLCLTEAGLSKGFKQLLEEDKRRQKKAKRDNEVRSFNKASLRSKIKRSR